MGVKVQNPYNLVRFVYGVIEYSVRRKNFVDYVKSRKPFVMNIKLHCVRFVYVFNISSRNNAVLRFVSYIAHKRRKYLSCFFRSVYLEAVTYFGYPFSRVFVKSITAYVFGNAEYLCAALIRNLLRSPQKLIFRFCLCFCNIFGTGNLPVEIRCDYRISAFTLIIFFPFAVVNSFFFRLRYALFSVKIRFADIVPCFFFDVINIPVGVVFRL